MVNPENMWIYVAQTVSLCVGLSRKLTVCGTRRNLLLRSRYN